MHQHFKTKLTIGSILLAVMFAGNVYADSSDHPKDRNHCKELSQKGHHDGLPPFLKGVDLTKDQQTQISTLAKEERTHFETQHQQRGKLMKELQQLSNADAFNEQQAQNVANQLANLEKEAFLDRARNGHKIFSLLTPAQRQKANENIQKHMEKMDSLKPVNFDHKQHKLSFKINS